MKSHNGMRPQDVVILIKLTTRKNVEWQYRDLATELLISISEVSESLTRSHLGGLVDESRRRVYRQSLMEFIEHGLHYVFPQLPGTMVTGIATAHSHPYFKKHFSSEMEYVWPSEKGYIRGLSIMPLHKGVSEAVKKDEQLHLLLAAIDIIRVGRAREIKMAIKVLKNHILNE